MATVTIFLISAIAMMTNADNVQREIQHILHTGYMRDTIKHPKSWSATFSAHGQQFDLKLVRNNNMRKLDKIPTIIIGANPEMINDITYKDVTFYQDKQEKASFSIHTEDGFNKLTGHIVRNGSEYHITHHERNHYKVDKRPHQEGLKDHLKRRTERSTTSHSYDKTSETYAARRRSGRSVTGTPADETFQISANIELLVMIDYSLVERTNNTLENTSATLFELKKYYAHVVNGVDLLYQNIHDMDPNLNFRVYLAGFVIAMNTSAFPWIENNIMHMAEDSYGRNLTLLNGNQALNAMSYALSKYYDAYPNYDHAMLFTGYDMANADGTTDTVGLAFTPGICEFKTDWTDSISLVEDPGQFQSILTAGHELGHSLGADHDGLHKDMYCDPSDQFIMAPSNGGNGTNAHINTYYFSCCSLQDIRNTVWNRTCIYDQTEFVHDPEFYNLVRNLTGVEYTADEQCASFFGNSSLCEWYYEQEPGVKLCESLWCTDPKVDSECHALSSSPAVGTSCGVGQWCIQSQCVNKTHTQNKGGYAPHTDDHFKNDTYTCCPLPKHLMNTNISRHSGRFPGGNMHPGDFIEYTCADGYNLNSGTLTRTCQPNAEWGVPPLCEAVPQSTLPTTIGTTRRLDNAASAGAKYLLILLITTSTLLIFV